MIVSAKYTFSTLHSFPYEIESEWNALERTDPLYTIFSSFIWLSTWWKHFGKAFTTHIIKIQNGQRTVGIASFVKRRMFFWKIPILKAISFVDGMATTYRDIIYSDSERETVCFEVFDYMLSNDPDWNVLSLWNICEDSPTNSGLKSFCKKHGLLMCQPVGTRTPIIKLTKSFDEYLQSLKPSVRRNIKNNMRRVLDHEGIKCNIIKSPTINDIDRFIELHQKLWNGRGELGVFNDNTVREFYRDVLLKLAASGQHIMFEIQYLGKPIAMCSRFVYRNIMHSFLEGWDPEWKNLGLGKVIDILSIQYAIEIGLSEYDFSIGDYQYKYEYTDFYKTNQNYLIFRTRHAFAVYNVTECIANILKKIFG
jgi:CelD/BcsL family acetyltransferase involved in cellulose biosynthesis